MRWSVRRATASCSQLRQGGSEAGGFDANARLTCTLGHNAFAMHSARIKFCRFGSWGPFLWLDRGVCVCVGGGGGIAASHRNRDQPGTHASNSTTRGGSTPHPLRHACGQATHRTGSAHRQLQPIAHHRGWVPSQHTPAQAVMAHNLRKAMTHSMSHPVGQGAPPQATHRTGSCGS